LDEWLYFWFIDSSVNLAVALISITISWIVYLNNDAYYESDSHGDIQLTTIVHFSICVFYPCILACGIALSTPAPVYHSSHPEIELPNEKQKDQDIIEDVAQDASLEA
jgi:hypothetical protein